MIRPLNQLVIGEDTMPTLAQRWLDEGKVEGRDEERQIEV